MAVRAINMNILPGQLAGCLCRCAWCRDVTPTPPIKHGEKEGGSAAWGLVFVWCGGGFQ